MQLEAAVGDAHRTVVGAAGHRAIVTTGYVAAAAAGLAVFLVGGLLLAVTLPYHDWDSFAFGAWSRQISDGGSIDPITAGTLGSARPFFYVVQGGVWAATGVSFTAGRLLSLAFGVLLLVAVALLAQTHGRDRRARVERAALAVLCVLAVAPLAQETLAGKSDVPAAAMLALASWLVLRDRRTVGGAAALAAACFAAMLTKPTVTAALAAVVAAVLLVAGPDRRARLLWTAAPVAGAVVAGLVYQAVMASRFETSLFDYLTSGTTDGLWAERAAAARWDAVLRLDVFGPGLRLPLAFALLYGLCRTLRADHRAASLVALPVAVVWAAVGPAMADDAPGAFSTWESGLTFVGFASCFAVGALATPDAVPSRPQVAVLFALGATPLAVWIYSTPYATRLAAAAWPGVVTLVALCLWASVRALLRLGPFAALAPVPVLATACWMAFATFDGLHGPQWVEYRSLGVDGVRDRDRTTNIVLPSVQAALAVVEPRIGDGRLRTADPRFTFFLPGRVTTGAPLQCSDLNGYTMFVLDTSDESAAIAREQGGLAAPDEWARCSAPKLEQLSDGSNGFAVFAVKG